MAQVITIECVEIDRAVDDCMRVFGRFEADLKSACVNMTDSIADSVIEPEFQAAHPARLRKKRRDFLWRWWLCAR